MSGSEERITEACAGWTQYKGIHKPRCNDGWGCHKCWDIFNGRRYAKMPEFNKLWVEFMEDNPDFATSEPHIVEEIEEYCWQSFIRGLELSLGPGPE